MRAILLLSVLTLSLGSALARLPVQPVSSPADIERRVESLLSQMTLEEKIDLLGGVDGFFIRGVPRLGVPRLKTADGPMGRATTPQPPRCRAGSA